MLLGSPSFISRALVALGIPMTAAWGYLRGWIWFFQRGKKRPEGTVEWTAQRRGGDFRAFYMNFRWILDGFGGEAPGIQAILRVSTLGDGSPRFWAESHKLYDTKGVTWP